MSDSSAGWNIADVWDAIAATIPDRVAFIHAKTRRTWSEYERRSSALGRVMLQGQIARQAKVALYLRNGPEYMEATYACFKSSLVPVNTNYRYREEELVYLWDNADAGIVVFHGEFTGTAGSVRPRLPGVRRWVHVEDGTTPCPDWAISYEDACAGDPMEQPWFRSGDDMVFMYTGGTTGMPKGVMWRQDDLYRAIAMTDSRVPDLELVRDRVSDSPAEIPVGLVAPPMMHATGSAFASMILYQGGVVVTLSGRSFDPVELLDAVQLHGVSAMVIVGDAFGIPLVNALDREPDRWDLSRLRLISSSGTIWSEECKVRLLRYTPDATLVDLLGSSEASGVGRTVSSREKRGATGRFKLGSDAFVIDEDGRRVAPGSGAVGILAVGGPVPLGYYKDPEGTSASFPVIDGVRCAVTGDFARVASDGSIQFLGRSSSTVNTGGEKVFAEEVAAIISSHPQVRDAVVLGVPDERLGQAVACLVQTEELLDGTLSAADVVEHVKGKLASYKAPRHIVFTKSIERHPNGKVDMRAVARQIVTAIDGHDRENRGA